MEKEATRKNPLDAWLIENGVTGKDFAAKAGVREATVSAWRRGDHEPSRANIMLIELATNGGVPFSAWFL